MAKSAEHSSISRDKHIARQRKSKTHLLDTLHHLQNDEGNSDGKVDSAEKFQETVDAFIQMSATVVRKKVDDFIAKYDLDVSLAEDLFQEAMLSIWKLLVEEPWMGRAAFHTAMTNRVQTALLRVGRVERNEFAKRDDGEFEDMSDSETGQLEVEELVEMHQLSQFVERQLTQPRSTNEVKMALLEYMQTPEVGLRSIADIHNVPINAIRTELQHVRKRVRQFLGE
jgi:DNA-directed RNA polymerase specialized sigma24 family protein